MSRRAVLSAVCASGNGAFEITARRVAAQQQRNFSSTNQLNVQITQFTQASTTSLNNLLAEIRTKIILPSFLPPDQRKRLHKAKWEKRLQSSPVTMELDDDIIKFRYEDPQKNVYDTSKTALSAVTQFKTDEDFDNLKPLLEGLYHAKRRIKPIIQAKILRLVCDKGYAYTIIDCARSVAHTNFKLDTTEKVNELLHHVQMRARDSDWDEERTKQSFRWCEMVVDMLSDEAHKPKVVRSRLDPTAKIVVSPLNCDPMILAAPLHLAAVVVDRFGAGDDVLRKVRRLAQHVVAYWPEGKGLLETQDLNPRTEVANAKYLFESNKFVKIATPLLHGLETAAKLLEPELAAQLMARHEKLQAEIQKARLDLPSDKPTIGSIVYGKFYDA